MVAVRLSVVHEPMMIFLDFFRSLLAWLCDLPKSIPHNINNLFFFGFKQHIEDIETQMLLGCHILKSRRQHKIPCSYPVIIFFFFFFFFLHHAKQPSRRIIWNRNIILKITFITTFWDIKCRENLHKYRDNTENQ